MMSKSTNNKLVLAYSGGLDTSVILTWLIKERGYKVWAYCADVGQVEDFEKVAAKAKLLGAEDILIDDCKEEYVKDYVFPMLRGNTIYEGMYHLGTAIARPLIAKRQVAYAQKVGAGLLSHGATGKGNDQLRFEFAYAALAPDMEVTAPWRVWDLDSRPRLVEYAQQNQIPLGEMAGDEPPYSLDANLLHISAEGKVLEDPWQEAPKDVYQWVTDPAKAPEHGCEITLRFLAGDAVALDGTEYSPAAMLGRLNGLAAEHGVGRVDMLETRTIGTKSRGVYETPGGTVLSVAHRALEHMTMDGGSIRLKDRIMPDYAAAIYHGYWFSPEREMLQALIDCSQKNVTGEVRLRLLKGAVSVIGRRSEMSLYDHGDASFDEQGTFSHEDAGGYIKLTALRLRNYAKQRRKRES